MYYNSTILTNLHNFRDYAVSGINYSVSGIAAHFAGLAVEVVSRYYLQRIQYLRYMKIPIAKALHEMTESFFSSSATINLKNDNGLFDTLKKITEPMWNYPGETVTAVMFSYLFEKFGIKYLDLTECVHNNYETDMSQPFGFVPGHSQNINSHGYGSALQHNHCNWDWSHITNEIYKGILSIAGSYSGALVYNDSQFYLNKYYSSENQPNVGKVKTEPNMNKIIEENLDDISKSEIINTQDLKVLKDLNYSELKCVSETMYAMYDFDKIVSESPVDMTNKLDKVVESDVNIETTSEMKSEDVDQSVDI